MNNNFGKCFAKKGVNDLWTVRPDIACLLFNPEDGYMLTKGSGRHVDFCCPNCGTVSNHILANVTRRGFSCSVCSDGLSYPNKFMASMLEQLNVDYQPEYIIDGKNYKYDFYLDKYNVIIEMHGRQHYEGWSDPNRPTLDKIQVNDIDKMNFAIKLIADLQDWCDTDVQALIANIDPSTPETAIASLAEINAQVGFVGNAYEVAVQCIRSCHWVPFSGTIIGGSSSGIYLGNYDTHLSGYKISASPITGNVAVSIPWHFSDWRRTYSENLYMYLPFVGQVSLNVDDLVNQSSISVKYSITASDGQVCYEVKSGDHIIGTYGGNCSMSIPIGINQKSSLGDITTTLFQGMEKTVASGVHTAELAGKANVLGAAGAGAQTAFNAVEMMYSTANVAMSTNLSTVGGIGGGAGAGLDMSVAVISVAHDTVIEPTVMTATMGQPTMKPVQLGSLHGYCQCANAHVAAPAELQELNEIDTYLNSGFYIE